MSYRELCHLWASLFWSWAVIYILFRIGVMEPKWPWVMPMFFLGAIGFGLLYIVCRVGRGKL